jgi:hypothetical protein
MSRASFVRAYRVAGAALIVVALVYIIWDRGGSDTFSLADFFSYFTVLSNCIAAVVLAVEGLWPGRDTGDRWQMVRGAAVLYMAITGVVYAVLLSDIDVQTPGFSNTVLHQVMPVVMVLDWLFEPTWVRLRFERALVWLVFPVLYLVYTLVRGPIADWYPYPFIDPDRHGYGRVAGNCVGIAAGFVAVTWLLTWAGNRLGDRR